MSSAYPPLMWHKQDYCLARSVQEALIIGTHQNLRDTEPHEIINIEEEQRQLDHAETSPINCSGCTSDSRPL